MATAQYVLEETEEDFNGPAITIHQCNDLRGNVQQIGRDPQHAITVRPRAFAAIAGALLMRFQEP